MIARHAATDSEWIEMQALEDDAPGNSLTQRILTAEPASDVIIGIWLANRALSIDGLPDAAIPTGKGLPACRKQLPVRARQPPGCGTG